MADILIKGMEMPKEGSITITIRHDGAINFIGDMGSNLGRLVDCKAIELPPHGDLIPYHAVKKAIVKYFGKDNTAWCNLMDEIDKIDVVVEGSRGTDN